MSIKNYPFAQELITDIDGNIKKVILDFQDYEQILEILDLEGLYQAMLTTKDEQPLSLESALEELEMKTNIKQMKGLLKTDQPAPNDEEVANILAEHKINKYKYFPN